MGRQKKRKAPNRADTIIRRAAAWVDDTLESTGGKLVEEGQTVTIMADDGYEVQVSLLKLFALGYALKIAKEGNRLFITEEVIPPSLLVSKKLFRELRSIIH